MTDIIEIPAQADKIASLQSSPRESQKYIGQEMRYIKFEGVKGMVSLKDMSDCFLISNSGNSGVIRITNNIIVTKKNIESTSSPIFSSVSYWLDTCEPIIQLLEKCNRGAKISEIIEAIWIRSENEYKPICKLTYKGCIITSISMSATTVTEVVFDYENIKIEMKSKSNQVGSFSFTSQ